MPLFQNNQSSPQPPRNPQNNFWSRIIGIFQGIINLITNQRLANFSQSIPLLNYFLAAIISLLVWIGAGNLNSLISNNSFNSLVQETQIVMNHDLCENKVIKKQSLFKHLRRSGTQKEIGEIARVMSIINAATISNLLDSKSSLTQEVITLLDEEIPDMLNKTKLDMWIGKIENNEKLTNVYPVFRWKCSYRRKDNRLTISDEGLNLDDYCKENFSQKPKATHHDINDKNSLYCVNPHHS